MSSNGDGNTQSQSDTSQEPAAERSTFAFDPQTNKFEIRVPGSSSYFLDVNGEEMGSPFSSLGSALKQGIFPSVKQRTNSITQIDLETYDPQTDILLKTPLSKLLYLRFDI